MKRNLVIITSFGLISVFLALIGCENDRNSDVICKNNPEICADLHQDSWCRFEKGDLIRHRYQLKQTADPSGKQLYQQLIYLETYSKCVELASGVQHILNPDRTKDRKRAYAVSTQTLSELQQHTKDNPDVYLAFYRWIRFNDKDSQNLVIEKYNAGEVESVEILSQLAASFVRQSPQKAIQVYKQLFDITPFEQFDPDWLLGLAKIYQHQQDLENVYIFTRANTLLAEHQVNEEQILALINNDTMLAQNLDLKAEALIDDIQTGNFANSSSAELLSDNKPDE
ncbi:DUF2989 domain-containing protein [Shewanella gaetbuli]|uniref:DUF2989 domain-containing protein n=1 Tax=Shewanella gaetbuli TaxID=220752 RepID=A0A9X2CKH9_9GAMM|nr:DUF2989 domain-containing protein [Shewanella gaetbuli]MCL1143116.1 DUF2989 domain-containing protein [Shewanella gaetbuli]